MDKLLFEFEPKTFEDWLEEVKFSIKGEPIDRLYSKIDEGLKIKPIYTRQDIEGLKYLPNEFPGMSYYIRGARVSGFKTKPWKIAQSFNVTSSEEYNKFLISGVENGLKTIIMEVYNDTNKIKGYNFSFLDAISKSLKGININEYEIFVRSNLFPQVCFLFKEYFNFRGFDIKTLSGGFEFNTYNIYLKEGTLPYREAIIDKIISFFEWSDNSFPNFYSICLDGSIFKECGGHSIHEIAFVLSIATDYLRIFASRNYDLHNVLKKIFFKLSFGGDFFIEIAKTRAIRLLWYLILKEISDGLQESKMTIFGVTSRRNKSFLDYYNNMLRNTTETLSAILSAVDYIETVPFDDPVGTRDEFAYRNSRNTQNVLLYEHNLLDTIDPVGGSWYIESLTFQLAKSSLELFKEVESMGGFYEALKNGFIQASINENINKQLVNLYTRRKILIGVNKYPQPINFADEIEKKLETKAEEPIFEIQGNKIFLLENEIFSKEKAIIDFFKNGGNLFSIRTSRDYQSVEIPTLNEIREAKFFENLFQKTNKFKRKYGRHPVALILNFGDIEDFRVRADFASDFLGVGGIEVMHSNPSNDFLQLAKEFIDLDYDIATFCSSDALYPQFVPQLASLIKKAKPFKIIILSGFPADQNIVNLYKNSGVDIFIHKKSNVLNDLQMIYALLGF